MARRVKRAVKYRFHPSPEQAGELLRSFGCGWLVFSKALQERTRAYMTEGRKVSYVETSAMRTAWKRTEELAFLGEVSSVPLQGARWHLRAGFVNVFAKRAQYPTVKSRKKSGAAAEYTRSAFGYRNGRLGLTKMADPLDIVWSRALPGGAHPTAVTVSRDNAGCSFVCLLCGDLISPLDPANTSVGLDAGSTSPVTLSTGEKITNPGHDRRDRRRLAKAQRALSRTAKDSNSRVAARRRPARVHVWITDRRRDFLHRLSTRLVRENQTVVIEAAWRQFRSMLEYTTDWYGRRLVVIDRWFPSSRLCSACGTLTEPMPLNVRERVCARGPVHGRDVNAAKNAAGPAES